jgi:hypothetical protein
MILYFVPVAAFFLSHLLFSAQTPRARPMVVLTVSAAAVYMAALISFRSVDVGNDTLRYFYEYLNAKAEWSYGGRGSEIGFSYLFKVARDFDLSFTTFNVGYGCFAVFCLLRVNARNFHERAIFLQLCYALGYFSMSLSGMRQILAASLTLLIASSKPTNVRAVLMVLLQIAALTIHNTAIVFAPVTALIIFRSPNVGRSTKLGLAGAVALLLYLVVQSVDLNDLFLTSRVENYQSSEALRTLNFMPVLFWVSVGFYAIYLGASARRRRRALDTVEQLDDPTLAIFTLSAIALIAAYLLAMFFPLMDRLSFYFQPIVFAGVAHHVTTRRHGFWQITALFAMSSAYLVFLMQKDYYGIVPYQFAVQ